MQLNQKSSAVTILEITLPDDEKELIPESGTIRLPDSA
jgi:hypothetical protein